MFGDVIHDTGVRLLRDKESGVFEVRNINIVQKELVIMGYCLIYPQKYLLIIKC